MGSLDGRGGGCKLIVIDLWTGLSNIIAKENIIIYRDDELLRKKGGALSMSLGMSQYIF